MQINGYETNYFGAYLKMYPQILPRKYLPTYFKLHI